MKYLTPIPKQFVDQSGIPYSNGTVSVYLSGSDELSDIFEDAEGDSLCPNPCRLDSNGAWQCFVTGDVPLDYIVENAEGNVVDSYFGVVISGGGTGDVTKAYVDTQDRALGARIDNLDQDLADEADRAEAAEKAAKTEVVGGENVTVEETIAPDGHSIFEVSSDGAPQQQSNWTQQDPSEPDYIKNKPTKLSDFTDDITKQSLVESGIGIEKPVSSAAVNAGLSEKADKVSNATAGNFATLDANGNLTDSGKNSADFATAEQGAKADSAVQGVKVNGTELSKDGNNVVDVPVPTASTETPLKDGTASAGSSSQWARGDHRHPTDDSREAVANKVQSIDDESETDYPSSKAVADFVNSSVATNTATFLGNFSLADLGLTYPATEVQIAAALNSHTWPTGYPTNNDYVYVEIRNPQSTIDDKVQRYKYRDGLASWSYEYTLNNSSFTAEEKSAIDSGITSQDVTNLRADHTTLGTHVANTSNPHNVTAAQVGAEPAFSVLPIDKGGTGKTTGKAATNNLFSDINNVNTDPDDTARIVFKYGSPSDSNGIFFARSILSLWNYIKSKISSVLGLSEEGYTGNAATATSASNYASGGDIDTALQGKYVKPSGGIPKTDLASGVQTSLGKADTAYQKPNGGIPDSDIASASTWNAKQDALPTTGSASTTYAINVSGKAATAGTADSANSVAWSNVSGKPTKLSDFTDDITKQTYIATGTGSDKPASGAAVKQAVGTRVPVTTSDVSNIGSTKYKLLCSITMNNVSNVNYAGYAFYLCWRDVGNANATGEGIVSFSCSEYDNTDIIGKVVILNSRGGNYIPSDSRLKVFVKVNGASVELWSYNTGWSDIFCRYIGGSVASISYPNTLSDSAPSGNYTAQLPFVQVPYSLVNGKGSTSVPVYVDSNGEVKACDNAIPTVDQNYNSTSTNPQSGTAVAQAVEKTVKKADASIIADGLSGERWYKVAESSFTDTYGNRTAAIEINYTDSEYTNVAPRKSNVSTMLVDLNMRSQGANEPYAVLVTAICSKIVAGLDVCVVSRGAVAQRKIELWVKCGGSEHRSSALISQRAFGTYILSATSSFTFTSYNGVVGQAKPVTDSANNVYVYSPELVSFDSTKDASWINSGTFDAARIPTSLPNVTVGTADVSYTQNSFIINKDEQTDKVWAKVAVSSTPIRTWLGYSITLECAFDGYGNRSLAAVLSRAYTVYGDYPYGGHTFTAYIYRGLPFDAKLVVNDGTLEIWMKATDTGGGLFVTQVGKAQRFSLNYAWSNNRSYQKTESEFSTYISDKTSYALTKSYLAQSGGTSGQYLRSNGAKLGKRSAQESLRCVRHGQRRHERLFR